jgi:hypothetical protein
MLLKVEKLDLEINRLILLRNATLDLIEKKTALMMIEGKI